MTDIILSDELRRFIQTIESIPHLEAMLLMHRGGDCIWDEKVIAERLYITIEIASKVLADLYAGNICVLSLETNGFIYSPDVGLDKLINMLAAYYSSNLIEVTNIIHAKGSTNRRARLFADAFLFRRED